VEVQAQVARAEQEKKQAQAENPLNMIPDLRDDELNQQFIVKVYALVVMMLCCTFIWVFYLMLDDGMADFVKRD